MRAVGIGEAGRARLGVGIFVAKAAVVAGTAVPAADPLPCVGQRASASVVAVGCPALGDGRRLFAAGLAVVGAAVSSSDRVLLPLQACRPVSVLARPLPL